MDLPSATMGTGTNSPKRRSAVNQEFERFQEKLLRLGFDYRPDEIAYLFEVAKSCARLSGLPLGAAMGAATAGVGSVIVPGIGSVPGWLVGVMAGFFSGTIMCTVFKGSIKTELDKLVRSAPTG